MRHTIIEIMIAIRTIKIEAKMRVRPKLEKMSLEPRRAVPTFYPGSFSADGMPSKSIALVEISRSSINSPRATRLNSFRIICIMFVKSSRHTPM